MSGQRGLLAPPLADVASPTRPVLRAGIKPAPHTVMPAAGPLMTDLVSTPPYEIHALEILGPNQFVVFSQGVRGGEDYESDTFRVPPILTPEMVKK